MKANAGHAAGKVLGLVALGGVLLLGVTALPAVADPDPSTPSQAEVDAAKQAVTGKARSVSAVQADLVMANQRLEAAGVKAAQAAEAYNAARWKLGEARRAVKAADASASLAQADLAVHEKVMSEVLAATYEMSPEITSLSALVGEDGIDGVIEKSNTVYAVSTSMAEAQDEYEASLEVADIATTQAEKARQTASDLADQAQQLRDAAQAQENAAMAAAARVARQKTRLIKELARLQNISVNLASRRQSALEAAAQRRAAAAAAAEQKARDEARQEEAAQHQTQTPPPQSDPTQQPTPDPVPQTDPNPPAPSAGGAQRAISFARDQIGEPYRWGADGPNSWDCSGLTMGAWRAGGIYLPHYSVGQYDASTPISSGQLQPGDLVFWGSSSSPGSIYHVALYIGDGQIIHAPRTGRPVEQTSMYYWIPPNFFGRP